MSKRPQDIFVEIFLAFYRIVQDLKEN